MEAGASNNVDSLSQFDIANDLITRISISQQVEHQEHSDYSDSDSDSDHDPSQKVQVFIHLFHSDDKNDGGTMLEFVSVDQARSIGSQLGQNLYVKVIEFCGDEYTDISRELLHPFYEGLSTNQSVESVTFQSCIITGDIFDCVLRPMLTNNPSLVELDIRGCIIFRSCIPQLLLMAFNHLYTLKCTDCLEGNDESDGLELGDQILPSQSELTSLEWTSAIRGHSEMSFDGLKALSALLQEPNCRLNELKLRGTVASNEVGGVLTTGLTGNHTLKSLSLGIHGLTNKKLPDWIPNCFGALEMPSSLLEHLDLSNYSFSYKIAMRLFSSLSDNNVMKNLTLRGCFRDVVDETWHGFATFLQATSLEKIDIRYNPFNSNRIDLFATSLVTNCKLKELLLFNDANWDSNWDAFSTTLSNRLSIEHVVNSNHYLEKVADSEQQPSSIERFLTFNQNENKQRVARNKVTWALSTKRGVEKFADMDLAVLLYFINTVLDSDNLFHIYRWLRNSLSIFGTNGRAETESCQSAKRQKLCD